MICSVFMLTHYIYNFLNVWTCLSNHGPHVSFPQSILCGNSSIMLQHSCMTRQLPIVKSWSPMWQNISIKLQLHGAKWTENVQETGLELSDLNLRILIQGQLCALGRFWIWIHPRKWIQILIHYGFTPSLTHLLLHPCMI